jgi:hypothetical protein
LQRGRSVLVRMVPVHSWVVNIWDSVDVV